ncbi:T9SS type A sorting domain-containing protein [Desulfosarcina sp.]|nr:T9SS type A sorting domain-containing protein [Desulfosarcina sp.]
MRLLTSLLLFIGISAYSQDTIRLMHYNLLMYGDNFAGCDTQNNNVHDKNGYLRTIIDFVKPDIVTVNELYKNPYFHDLILDSVFNIDGIDYYKKGNPPNLSNGYTINQIYFNSKLFTLTSDDAIETNVRDIDTYRLSYNLANTNNDADLNCVVAHLKAGNSPEDAYQRANETNALMEFLNNSNATGNYIMSGDFNVYTPSEVAFTNLILHENEDIRFYDPVNRIGEWHNNSNFSDVHTQSTHISGDCYSGGGMDDRFDFVLISDEIRDGTGDTEYLPDSYWAVGQDGLHFNKSLTASPQNTSVPPEVLSALYNMSDHLPVIIDLVVDHNLSTEKNIQEMVDISFANPVSSELIVQISKSPSADLIFEIYSLHGKKLYSSSYKNINSNQTVTIPVNDLETGIYFLNVLEGQTKLVSKKIIKL